MSDIDMICKFVFMVNTEYFFIVHKIKFNIEGI